MMNQKTVAAHGDKQELDDNHPHFITTRHVPKYAHVLELGCGSGALSALLQEVCQAKIIGIDKDPQAVWRAQRYCEHVLEEDLNYHHSLDALAFERFDVILLLNLLPKLQNPTDILERIKPLLLDEGTVVLSIPNLAHASTRLSLLQGDFSQQDQSLIQQTLPFCTLEAFTELLQQAGYVALAVECVWEDISEKQIIQQLKQMGLEASDKFLETCREPIAMAQQFVITIRPKKVGEIFDETVIKQTLKPVVNSNQAWGRLQDDLDQQQQIIRGLELELEHCRERLVELSESHEATQEELKRIHQSRTWQVLNKAELMLRNNFVYKPSSS